MLSGADLLYTDDMDKFLRRYPSGMGLYKDSFTDFMMQHPKSNPRYAGLARKVLKHYLGDLYNIHTHDCDNEYFIRNIVTGYIKLKVFDKQPYDIPFIDHFFKKVLHDAGYTHLTYDETAFEKGYNGVMRGELPKYTA